MFFEFFYSATSKTCDSIIKAAQTGDLNVVRIISIDFERRRKLEY